MLRLLTKNHVYDSRIAVNETNRRRQFQLLAGCILLLVAVTGRSYAQFPLVSFSGSANGDGPYLGYPIVMDASGNGYGTTSAGGTYDQGVFFEVTPSGTLTNLYTFCSQINCADGAEPFSGPVQGPGGNFYGTTYWGGVNGQGTVFMITKTGLLTTLHSFAGGPTDGAYPIAGLVLAANGNFYGTTQLGGVNGAGTVFEMTPAGQVTTLYSFCSQTNCSDGSYPWAGLVQATNGNFYGTTPSGGSTGNGTVFQITPAGQLTTIYNFCSLALCADGSFPRGGLVQATNGNLYGTTVNGGIISGTGAENGTGTIFEITTTGQLTTLYNFCSQTFCTDGVHPYAGLLQASDGNLYGTTEGGFGPNLMWSFGTVFGMTPAGQLTTLYNFCHVAYCSDGAYPYGGLAESASGILFGTTNYGGNFLVGTVFSLPVGLTPAKTQKAPAKTAAKFAGIGHGVDLAAATDVMRNRKGAMLPDLSNPKIRTAAQFPRTKTTATKEKVAVAAAHNSAPPVTSILDLYGANGAFPYFNTLTQGSDGNLYGTTAYGGTAEDGTVFQLTPGGTLTTIYTFCTLANCTDGGTPFSGMVQGANGNFYGTTPIGGNGAGTVFEITTGGQLTTLYNFCSQAGCADGDYTQAGLVLATNGNFYGATSGGGAQTNGNGGTIFEITPGGQLTTLYRFCSQTNCTDGSNPVATLVQASNGNLYGTTTGGGSNGAGTVFQITLGGTLTTLYSFCSQTNCADGFDPLGALVQANNGNLYGTTQFGGTNGGGTVFQITPAGQLTTLYSFCSQTSCADGSQPYAGLVQAGGNLYGTTCCGGANGWGTVFEITPSGQLTTVYSFDFTDGAYPEGALVLANNGSLYGMTVFGGDRLDGTIFNLPPVISLSGPTGTAQVGVPYSSSLVASGGVPPYTYSIASGTLPPVLSLNGSTGAITGTPTTGGTFSFTAEVVDSQENSATVISSIVVTSGTTLSMTTLSLSPSSLPQGSIGPVVMTATVSPGSGAVLPTGTVTFFNGSTQLGTTVLSEGVAQFNFNPSSLPVGQYSITAVYGGDNNYAGSTSQPQTLFITQTGPFAYVANLLSNTVSMISIPSGQVVNSIPVGPAPIDAAISPDGTQVYVSNNNGNDVAVIDTASSTVVATIPVQSFPVGLAFTPDGTSAYVANFGSNTVSVINTSTQTVTSTVPVGHAPGNVTMAVTSVGTFAYVPNTQDNTVSVIAVGPNPTVVQTINVGTDPDWVTAAPNSSVVYVTNGLSNNVSVISVATNTVTATIPVGSSPQGVAVSPDSTMAYVVNASSNTMSVIYTATESVIQTISGFSNPRSVAVSTDGSVAYVVDNGSNSVSVVATATNNITSTIGVGSGPIGLGIGAASQATLQIMLSLSPTMPNTFTFPTTNYVVQYPANSSFSGVNMTTSAIEMTQAQFAARVAGTKFSNATCIVDSGTGGNCVDYLITCSDTSGNSISCPSESTPSIAVQTGFSTSQAIVNPGFLTTPVGKNLWTNIFTGFSDPTVKGKTSGFGTPSAFAPAQGVAAQGLGEFVAVSLGATNSQGAATLQLLLPKVIKSIQAGNTLPIEFQLTSVANGSLVTDAKAGITVTMIADAHGNPTSVEVYSHFPAFKEGGSPAVYRVGLPTAGYAAGTYQVDIYGDAFSSYQFQFKVFR